MTVTLNSLSSRQFTFVSFIFFLEFYFSFCLEHFPLYPYFACVFLYIKQIGCISWSLKSDFMCKVSCGAQWYNLLWSPEPGAPGVFLVWASIAFRCGWATIAMDAMAGKAEPWLGQLQGQATTVVGGRCS